MDKLTLESLESHQPRRAIQLIGPPHSLTLCARCCLRVLPLMAGFHVRDWDALHLHEVGPAGPPSCCWMCEGPLEFT